jgi:hypothetical protein
VNPRPEVIAEPKPEAKKSFSTDKDSPEIQGLPKITFVRKLQEKLVTTQIKMVTQRNVFYTRALTDDELTITLVNKKAGRETEVPRRCSSCLDPASHVEVMSKDSTYFRPLCTPCVMKGK